MNQREVEMKNNMLFESMYLFSYTSEILLASTIIIDYSDEYTLLIFHMCNGNDSCQSRSLHDDKDFQEPSGSVVARNVSSNIISEIEKDETHQLSSVSA